MNIESMVSIIVVAFIAALFFAWFFFQQARNYERMELIERGEKLGPVFQIEKRDKIKVESPWLKVGIVTTGMSLAFLGIAFLIRWLDNDMELFKGFLITFILGFCPGVSFLTIHFLGKKEDS